MSPWSVVLIAGEEQRALEAELGMLTPSAGAAQWGGVLRGVPVRQAAAMRQGDGRLLLPSGQRPAGAGAPRRHTAGGQPRTPDRALHGRGDAACRFLPFILLGLEFDAETARHRAIAGAMPPHTEPCTQPRDTRKWTAEDLRRLGDG